MTYPHDLNLGTRPTERELNSLLHEHRNAPLLLGLMHYLRDDAAVAIGESTEARREGLPAIADMALGAHERLTQLLVKWDTLRNSPVPVEESEAAA